jgi:nucleotide-binding universal stress UspA family protein
MIRKILVALDRSELSSQVLKQAVDLAKATQASLMLLYVLAPFEKGYSSATYPGLNGAFFGGSVEAMKLYLDQWKILEQESLEWLRSQEAEAKKAGVETEFTYSVGDPGHIICTLAKTWEADLIFVGRRGLSGLSQLFLGSVSNYVLHRTPCSVLVVQEQNLPQDELPHQEAPSATQAPS